MGRKLKLKWLMSIIILLSLGAIGKETGKLSLFKSVSVRADVKKKLVCEVDKLNVRIDGGVEASLLYSDGKPVFMKKNQEAEVIGEKNGWYKVRFLFEKKEVVGFVISTFVKVSEEKTEVKKIKTENQVEKKIESVVKGLNLSATVIADSLRMREDAGTGFQSVKMEGTEVRLRKADKLIVTGTKSTADGKRWYAISVKKSGKKLQGYALSDYIKLTVSKKKPAKAFVALKGGLVLRKKASDKGKAVVDDKGKAIKPGHKKKLKVFYEINLNEKKYFKVSYKTGGNEYSGYVPALSLDFSSDKSELPEEKVEKVTEEEPKEEESSSEKTEAKKEEGSKVQEEIDVSDQDFKAHKAVLIKDTELFDEASDKAQILKDSESDAVIKLKKNLTVIARRQYTRDGVKWYLITYEISENGIKKFGAGFLPADRLHFTGELVGSTTGSSLNESLETPEAFLARMEKEGFPASYLPYLASLREVNPYRDFKAKKLFLDWEDAVNGENKLGLNLISNSKNVAFKSLEKGAYNWENDSFRVYDGVSFVTVSEKGLRYFMDPRNFLNEDGIYQFELLSYQPEIHTLEGIEKILEGSPLSGTYTFKTEKGEKKELSYAETFLLAGVYSGVSPFYLAGKSRLEVAGGGRFSKSASGDMEDFEGLYNFYNIGASDSPYPMGAVINGLRFAKSGRKDRKFRKGQSFNEYIKLPWDNPYKAILGGAAYIGEDYVNKGQNTLYLEKFNLTEFSTYNHQYMSNIEGPLQASRQIKKAYKNLGELPLIFSIPVLQNMPENAEPLPLDEKNPNHYLSKLEVKKHKLSPEFSPSVTEYEVKLKKEVKKVEILAEAVNKKASLHGEGLHSVKKKGETKLQVEVTAENGEKRVYVIRFKR